jgi:hypothetical protein
VWSHPARARPRDPGPRLVPVAQLLLVLTVAMGGASISRGTSFSAIDEATHLDYAWKTVHGSVPYDGDVMARYTLDEWACHGQANIPNLPACGSNAPAGAFPASGVNYNGFHPPVYYFLTGLGADVISTVAGTTFFIGARLTDVLWTFLGLFAFYLVLRYWRVRWMYALAYAAVLVTVPAVLASASTVTNDAPVLLAGSAALFVLGRVLVYQRTGWVLPAVLAALVASTKVISVVALVAVGLVLLIWAVSERRTRGFRSLRPVIAVSLAMGAAALVVYEGWNLVQHHLAVPGFVNPIAGISSRPMSGGFPLAAWLPSLVSGFDLGTDYYLDPRVDGQPVRAWALAFGLFCGVIGFVVLAKLKRGSAGWWAGLTLVVGCLVYPVIVQLQELISSGGTRYFVNLSSRYGQTLIPVAVALLALLASRYRWRRSTIAVVSVGVLVAVAESFGLL